MSKRDKRADEEYMTDQGPEAYAIRHNVDMLLSEARNLEELVAGFASRKEHSELPRTKHLVEWTARYIEDIRTCANRIIDETWKL